MLDFEATNATQVTVRVDHFYRRLVISNAVAQFHAGLVELRNMWAHPDDVEAIRQHARDLAAKRAAAKAAG
jgi:hypothetical protein